MRGQSLNWFKSHLSDRTQYVQYKNICSDNKYITTGVQQRSVQEAPLFIVYTHDLPVSLTYIKAILFADDTTQNACSRQLNEAYHKINNDLYYLCDCFKTNKLTLSSAKTNYMFSHIRLIIITVALVFVLVLLKFYEKM